MSAPMHGFNPFNMLEKMLRKNIERSLEVLTATTNKLQAPRFNLLEGFDMLYGVTQQTVNKQFKTLYALDLLPNTWTAEVSETEGKKTDTLRIETKYILNANLGVPTVDFNTGDASSRKVLMRIPLSKGSLNKVQTIIVEGNTHVKEKKTKISGYVLELTTNLSLVELSKKWVANSKVVPNSVKKQLNKFQDNMFTIEHLHLNLNSADLLDTFSIKHNGESVSKDSPSMEQALRNLLKVHIEKLRASDNPYILGYAVKAKVKNQNNATFKPTGVTYSTFSDTVNRDMNTLNYLLVTDGRDVPGAGYGVFKHNWVNDKNSQGSFVFSESLILEFILCAIAPLFEKTRMDFTLARDKQNHVATLSMSNDQSGTTTVTVKPEIGTNKITCSIVTDFKIELYRDLIVKNVYMGYIKGKHWVSHDISFTMDKNNIKITSKKVEDLTGHSRHLNDFGKVISAAEALAKVTSKLPIVNIGGVNLMGLIDQFGSVKFVTGISRIFADLFRNTNLTIIPPAGGVFFFKQPEFQPDGSLKLATTVKN